MIPIQVLIDRLKSQLSYDIQPSREIQPIPLNVSDPTVIYVGYHSMTSKNPNAPIDLMLFNAHGEDIEQLFDIHIDTTIENLPTVWRAIYTAITDYTPIGLISSQASVSGFCYTQSGLVGLTNGRIVWLDRWRIGFPSATPLV